MSWQSQTWMALRPSPQSQSLRRRSVPAQSHLLQSRPVNIRRLRSLLTRSDPHALPL